MTVRSVECKVASAGTTGIDWLAKLGQLTVQSDSVREDSPIAPDVFRACVNHVEARVVAREGRVHEATVASSQHIQQHQASVGVESVNVDGMGRRGGSSGTMGKLVEVTDTIEKKSCKKRWESFNRDIIAPNQQEQGASLTCSM
jgi:hypothetical protein